MKKISLALFAIVLLFAIPISIYLTQRPHDTRSRAQTKVIQKDLLRKPGEQSKKGSPQVAVTHQALTETTLNSTEQIIITFKDDVSSSQQEKIISDQRTRSKTEIKQLNTKVIEVKAEELDTKLSELKKNSLVESVEKDEVVYALRDTNDQFL